MYYFSTMLFLHTLICDTGALFMKSTGPRYRRGWRMDIISSRGARQHSLALWLQVILPLEPHSGAVASSKDWISGKIKLE